MIIPISMLDLAGSILTVLFIILLIRRRRMGWLFGGLGSGIYVVVLFQSGLYFQSTLFAYYVAMAVYGFAAWTSNRNTDGTVIVSQWRSAPTNILAFVLLITLGVALSTLLTRYTSTTMGFADATITTVAFFATYLQARSKVENWYYWVFVNALTAFVSFFAGLYSLFLLSLFLLGMSFYGILKWHKIVVNLRGN